MIDWKKTSDGYPEDEVPVILFVSSMVGRIGYRMRGEWWIDNFPWKDVDYWAYYTPPIEDAEQDECKSTF